nr:reverse transcriptase domain-containing protein [Tanacetum cinerariifolium]
MLLGELVPLLQRWLSQVVFGVWVLHALNHLIEDHGNDVGLLMLLVDFKNVFNLVDREVMLEEVHLRGPAISRKALELIMEDGLHCGLHLNVDKTKVLIWPKAKIWRLAIETRHLTLCIWGLGVYSAGDVLNYAFLASRLQSVGLQAKLLQHASIVAYMPTFDDVLSVFNTSMEADLLSNPSEIVALKLIKNMANIYFTRVTKNTKSTFPLSPRQIALWKSQREDHTSDWLRAVPIFGLGKTINGKTYRCVLCYRLAFLLFYVLKPCSACSRVFLDIYGDHVASCAGIIGIKHRQNVVRDTLVDICFCLGIAAGFDVCMDLTGSLPLTQTGMVDFVPGRAVIDVAQRKRVKYIAKCAIIRYGFLPFPFSSFGESEEDTITLLKQIRKFSMVQDIRGCDKPLRPTIMLLYSWGGGLDVCVDLTGSSPLTQTEMADFGPDRAMIDNEQRKRAKYMAKCAAIGYDFLPFSFSSLEELEDDEVTLMKRIRKFSMTQKIKARAVVHISNRICFAIDKGMGLPRWENDPGKLGTAPDLIERLVSDQSSNPTSSMNPNPKGRNCRRSKQRIVNSNLEENSHLVVTMADQRTMAQLLQAPIEGYEDAIVVPTITADNFELKHGLLTLVQNKQFYGHNKKDLHAHICYFNNITSTLKLPNVPNTSIKLMLFPFSSKFFPSSKTTSLRNEITNFQQRFDESFSEAWGRFKDLLRACPHHGFLELHQLDTFYNALNSKDQDPLNSAAGGNFLDKMPRDCLSIIESKSKVRYSHDKPVVSKVSTNASTSDVSPDVAELKDMVKALLLNKKRTCYQPSVFQQPAPAPQTQGVSKEDFSAYVKANDAVMKNMQTQGQNMHNQLTNLTDLITKFMNSNTASTSSSVVENEPEATKDTVNPTNNENTEDVQPQAVQSKSLVLISELAVAPVSASKPNPKASILYPSRRKDEMNHEKANNQIKKFYQIFKDMSFEIRFADALILMPKFASTLKALIGNKKKLSEMARIPLNEHFSVVLLKKLPKKLGDPDKFLIPCDFPRMAECLVLADLGASINLMPYSMWTRLSLPDLTPTCMTLELSDRLIFRPVGVAEDVYVKVGSFYFPANFVVVDFDVDPRVPLILGISFLETKRALIDVFEEYSQEFLGFSDTISSGNPTLFYDSIVSTTSPTLTPFENSDFLLEEVDAFLVVEDEPTSSNFQQPYLDPEGDILLLEAFLNDDPSSPPLNQRNYLPEVRKELKIYEAKTDKSSVDEPPVVELKALPLYLKYAFLEEDFTLAVQRQRRVNPKIHDVIKQEVIKLLDAGLIYPISDSPWVSPVHYVPKKGGFTVVENEDNELIPTRLVTGWHVLNQYYCFLDGFSGYFQIPIDPKDQEKTTFTCPYGTFAYCRMPFGLCNVPGTFQRNSFQSCLSHLEKMLKRKLTEAPILIALDWDKPFELMCDASDFAIGEILGQRQDKHFRPIHYASKTMTEAESNYTTTEKEMLAMVYSFEKFRSYLILNKTIVYADHFVLKCLFAKKDSKARLL